LWLLALHAGRQVVSVQDFERVANSHQIEQFIESIYPTQDPKALAAAQAEQPTVDENAAVEASKEAKQDVMYLMVAVIGTLFVISGLMV
jgi:farnesyl-diphosphate farnesyltransferase